MITCFYGCARKHRPVSDNVLVLTNDIDKRYSCNFIGDVREILAGTFKPGISLDEYDCFIFTPPCNYYSRANYRRDTSSVALATKDLLPLCLNFCIASGKPFLVENVMNHKLLGNLYPKLQIRIGGHTFWSNLLIKDDLVHLPFEKNQNKQFVATTKRDDNVNVNLVILKFLDLVKDYYND